MFSFGKRNVKIGLFSVKINDTYIGVIKAGPKITTEEGSSIQNEDGDDVVYSYRTIIEFEDLQMSKDNYEWLRERHNTINTVTYIDLNTTTNYKVENCLLNIKPKIEGNHLNIVNVKGYVTTSSATAINIFVPAPEISVSPLSIGLGEIGEGETTDGSDYTTISNSGTKALSLSSIVPPTNYEIKWGSGGTWENNLSNKTVNISDSEDLYVRVTPPDANTYAGNIVINSDDDDEPTTNVAVTVDGVSGAPGDYISYLKFDGNLADETGNHDGSLIAGSISYVNDQKGEGSSAASFGYNETDKVDLGNFTETFTTFTISMWIDFNSLLRNNRSVFCLSNNGWDNNDSFNIRGTGGSLQVVVKDASGNAQLYNVDGGGLTGWHHVIIEKDGFNHKTWIDNSLEADFTLYYNPTLISPDENFIGSYSSGNCAGFSISDYRLYNRVLSNDERTAIYDEEKPV